MTTSRFDHSAEQHVADGALLALHDGERGAELHAQRVHVEQCDDCGARLAAISNHAKQVHESLSAIPVPAFDAERLRRRISARPRPVISFWRRPAIQAAAAVVVLTVAAAASPARHWVEQRFGHAAPPVTAPRSPGENAPTPRAVSGATVSFPATGPEFTVHLDSLPAAGVLVVDRTTADEISAQVTSGAGTGGDAMLVLPGELRLRNSASSQASYRISVSPVVTRVRVVVAGSVVFDGAPPAEVKLAR